MKVHDIFLGRPLIGWSYSYFYNVQIQILYFSTKHVIDNKEAQNENIFAIIDLEARAFRRARTTPSAHHAVHHQ